MTTVRLATVGVVTAAVVLAVSLASGAWASGAMSSASATASVASVPYEATHAWAFTYTGTGGSQTVPVPTTRRLILTGLSPGGVDCTVTGALDGSPLSYVLVSPAPNSFGQFAGYSDALDGSTPITVVCNNEGTLIGYLAPLP